MAEIAHEFQLMKEFQRLREKSNQFLISMKERTADPIAVQDLTENEVIIALYSTNDACFDLLMRQEHEWQARIRELEMGWEEKAQEQSKQWLNANAEQNRSHAELKSTHEHFMASSKARMEQMEEYLQQHAQAAASTPS